MTTLFISDLHLDETRPAIAHAFLQFLSGEALQADALYILGDLFESWLGDDDESALATAVADGLAALADTGVPCWFMHGNRDFLLGDAYATRAGLRLLPQSAIVTLYDVPTLLLHGDTLCTDDEPYQHFRAQVRDPQWQRDFLAQPLAQRRAFADLARGESARHTASHPMQIMDVNQGAVETALREAQRSRLIHGHTHRAAVHTFDLDGNPAERIVLGDWYHSGSVLRVGAEGIEIAPLALS